jgi:uncharacterized protein (TIGR00730 family)
VYCAASPRHPDLLELATRVGEAIADRGWTLVSGGGNVSAMGAVAVGARSRGGRTVGVIPKALVHRELADIDADELIVTETMRQRKQLMEDRSDAFLALPGGIGTLEELFESWTGPARPTRPLLRTARLARFAGPHRLRHPGRPGPAGRRR